MTFDMPSFKLHWEVGRSNHFGESGRSPPLPSVSCLDLATMCHLQYMLIVSWHNLFLWCMEWSIEILVPAFQKRVSEFPEYEYPYYCIIFLEMLDRHHVWRSQDPTLDICSNFVKSHLPPFFPLLLFFKKRQLFIKEYHFFCIWLSARLSDAFQSH